MQQRRLRGQRQQAEAEDGGAAGDGHRQHGRVALGRVIAVFGEEYAVVDAHADDHQQGNQRQHVQLEAQQRERRRGPGCRQDRGRIGDQRGPQRAVAQRDEPEDRAEPDQPELQQPLTVGAVGRAEFARDVDDASALDGLERSAERRFVGQLVQQGHEADAARVGEPERRDHLRERALGEVFVAQRRRRLACDELAPGLERLGHEAVRRKRRAEPRPQRRVAADRGLDRSLGLGGPEQGRRAAEPAERAASDQRLEGFQHLLVRAQGRLVVCAGRDHQPALLEAHDARAHRLVLGLHRGVDAVEVCDPVVPAQLGQTDGGHRSDHRERRQQREPAALRREPHALQQPGEARARGGRLRSPGRERRQEQPRGDRGCADAEHREHRELAQTGEVRCDQRQEARDRGQGAEADSRPDPPQRAARRRVAGRVQVVAVEVHRVVDADADQRGAERERQAVHRTEHHQASGGPREEACAEDRQDQQQQPHRTEHDQEQRGKPDGGADAHALDVAADARLGREREQVGAALVEREAAAERRVDARERRLDATEQRPHRRRVGHRDRRGEEQHRAVFGLGDEPTFDQLHAGAAPRHQLLEVARQEAQRILRGDPGEQRGHRRLQLLAQLGDRRVERLVGQQRARGVCVLRCEGDAVRPERLPDRVFDGFARPCHQPLEAGCDRGLAP